ncbi:DUF5309 domain-containing protein [Rhizobium sp. XQZ8]|uniref:SU10 major capsid protein n=1 Tax=Rhizobium populisoli TaxID=2859785 RepID=UPI001C666419|nr:DUF5309 family protein [Rhizobium populisoli]MBW6421611.1 DUF5309 domain-containing protein [Rhizobium populisoli]
MAITLTTALKNINEDLANTISNIAPSATPVYTKIGKTKASHTYHEVLVDTLAAPNKDNARAEAADALVPSNAVVSRVGNFTQIVAKEVSVAGTVDAVSTAGKGEFARQLANVMKEAKTDIEASIVSGNASVAGATRKSAGMEAWIKTNAVENGGSSTPGFSSTLVGAPVAGTPVVVTEAMVQTLAQNMYNNGAEIKELIASPLMKTKLSALLSGNASRWNNAKDKSATSAVDYYATDFGEFAIKPHRMVSNNTVIAYDPELWAVATLRPFKTEELAKTGDARKVQLLTEFTLECRNEVGNGKIAGIKTA